VTFLIFFKGSSLMEGIGIKRTYLKVLKDFEAKIFKVDLLIIITTIFFSVY